MRHSPELGFEDGFEHFKARYDKGFRVVSYAMSGAPARHSFILRRATATSPDQRMSSRPRKGGTNSGSFHQSMVEQTADGYYPAYVAGFGDPEPTSDQHEHCHFSAVYEKLAGAASAPYMIEPVAWGLGYVGANDFVNALAEGDAAGFYARSVGVVGVPKRADLDLFVGNTRDSGLRFFATMWPKPSEGFGWAVHLTPNITHTLPDGDPEVFGPYPWWLRWEAAALSTQAYPVAGSVTRSMPSDQGLLSMTLTLWRDVRYKPWPEGDPFKVVPNVDPHERSFEVIVADDQHIAASLTTQDNQHDRRPLSVGATRDGMRTVFFVPLGRKGSEDPFPREAFVTDPFTDHGETVPLPGKKGYGARPGGRVKVHPELVRWVLARMKRYGARHAQIVVVRRGVLVHASAVTWAEAGYTMCKLDHALRIGSVSKSLTAMMLLGKVVPYLPDGLDTYILRPDLLDVSTGTPAAMLGTVTLRNLLAMNAAFVTGDAAAPFFSRDNLLAEVTGQPRTAWQQAFDIVEPGTYTKFFAGHASDDYFATAPGTACSYPYTNENFLLLGEMVAKYVLNDPAKYNDASIDFLGAVGVHDPEARRQLLSQGWPAALLNGESPCQVRSPGHVWNRFMAPGAVDYKCPSAYGPDGLHSAGAGGWCVPLVWFARILRGLCPLPGLPPYLDRKQLDQMAELAGPSCNSGDETQAHGCYRDRSRRTFSFRADGILAARDRDVARIFHNGMIEGGSALWGHQFPVVAGASADLDTLSFCVALNQDEPNALGAGEGSEIFDILQRMETQAPLLSSDLFNVV